MLVVNWSKNVEIGELSAASLSFRDDINGTVNLRGFWKLNSWHQQSRAEIHYGRCRFYFFHTKTRIVAMLDQTNLFALNATNYILGWGEPT